MNHFPITFTHIVKLKAKRIEVNRHPLDQIKIKTFCRSFGLINRQTSSSMHDVHGHYAKVKLSVEANSSVVVAEVTCSLFFFMLNLKGEITFMLLHTRKCYVHRKHNLFTLHNFLTVSCGWWYRYALTVKKLSSRQNHMPHNIH